MHQTFNRSLSAQAHIQSAAVNSDTHHIQLLWNKARERNRGTEAASADSNSPSCLCYSFISSEPWVSLWVLAEVQSVPDTWGPAVKWKQKKKKNWHMEHSYRNKAFQRETFAGNRCLKPGHDLTGASGCLEALSVNPLVPSLPSDRECRVLSQLGVLTLVRELFLSRHSEKDKSPAQIPN